MILPIRPVANQPLATSDRIAGLLAASAPSYGPAGAGSQPSASNLYFDSPSSAWLPQTSAPTQPADPFVWGSGGEMLTPQEIARRRQNASQLMQPDYSPIASPWQGLARVAQNLVGALDEKKADKADRASQAYNARIAAALSPGGSNPSAAAAAAITNPYASDGTRELAKLQLGATYRKPQEPHYFQDNAGNEWSIGPDGKRTLAFADPTPRYYVQGDQAVQIPNPFVPGGVATPSAPSSAPQAGAIEDGYRFKGGNAADPSNWEPVGGPTQPASGGFRP